MSGNPAHLLSALRRQATAPGDGPAADAGLLRRYALTADPEAFAELVRRHGPAVLGVCRRVLGRPADADDAFQAAFLVLARKAGSVRGPSAGSWLYGVARRVSVRLRDKERRRARHEREWASRGRQAPEADAPGTPESVELAAVLDEELARLPAGARAAVLACHVRGLTQEQAAAELGLSLSTVRRRLEAGRERLRERLTRRLGVGAAVLAGGTLAEGVSAGLVEGTREAAAAFVAGGRTGSPATILAHEVLTMMTRIKLATTAGLVVLVAGLGVGTGAVWPAAQADDPPAKAPAPKEVAKRPAEAKKVANPAATKVTADDLIRPGERLKITVLSVPQPGSTEELALGEVRVEPNGKVPLGLRYGGRVKLAGLTVEDAEEALSIHLQGAGLTVLQVEVIRLDWAVAPARPGMGGDKVPAAEAIRPGDRLAVQFDVPVFAGGPGQSSFGMRVESGGTVALGLIYGRVTVGGLTVDEAEEAIRKAIIAKTGALPAQVPVQVVIDERATAPDGRAADGKLKDRVQRLEREVADLKKALVEELRKR